MGSGYGKAGLPAGDFSQHFGALYDAVTLRPGLYKFREILAHGRSIDYQSLLHSLGKFFGTAFVVDPDSFDFQSRSEFAAGTVISAHIQPLGLAETGKGAHPYAAYSYKICF